MESACKRGTWILPVLTVCLFYGAGLASAHGDDGEDSYATCIIEPLGFPGMNISGTIKLHESCSSEITTLVGHLYGFEKGNTSYRGFHVHSFGNISGNCSAAGPHYNPFNKTHGAPNDTERHVGDLGNIVVDSNLEAMVNISDSMISLHGDYSIVNRTLVVHAWEDDLGRGNQTDSKTTGHSGYRIGCCIITLDQQVTTAPPEVTMSSALPAITMSSALPAITMSSALPAVTMSSALPAITMSSAPPEVTMSSALPAITMSSERPAVTTSSSPSVPTQTSPAGSTMSEGPLPGILICLAGLQLLVKRIQL